MKIPVYVPERDLTARSPHSPPGRHDISALSEQQEALTGFGRGLEKAGDILMGVHAEQEKLRLEAEAKMARRKKEEDDLRILSHLSELSMYYTEDLQRDFQANGRQNPTGWAGRYMDKVRENLKGTFDELSQIDRDYAVNWGQKIISLQNHLYNQAIHLEAQGRIAHEDDLFNNSVRSLGNSFLNSAVDIEALHQGIGELQRVVDNMSSWSEDHRNKQKVIASTELTQAYIRGLIKSNATELAEKILNSGQVDKYISPDIKNSLMSEVIAGGRQANAELRYQATEAVKSELTSIYETGLGNPELNQGSLKKILGDAAYAQYQDDRRQAFLYHKSKLAIDNAPFDKMIDIVEKLKQTSPTGRYNADNLAVAKQLEAYVNSVQAEIMNDPVAYGMRKVQDLRGKAKNQVYFYESGLNAAASFANPETKAATVAEFRKLITSSLAYLRDRGIPVEDRVTPKAMIVHDIKTIQSLPAEQVGDFLNGQKDIWGPELFARYWKDLCKIGKLPAQYKMAMFAEGTVFEPLIVNAIRMSDEQLKKLFPEQTAYNEIHRAIIGELQPFIKLVNLGAASGLAYGEVADMAHVLTKAAGIQYGSAISTKSPNKLARELVDGFVNDRFIFTQTYAIPKELRVPSGDRELVYQLDDNQASKIKRTLDYLKTQEGMSRQGFVPKMTGGRPYLDTEFKQKLLNNTYARDAYWVSNEEFDGVYLQFNYGAIPQPIVNSSNRRYEIKFKDILDGKITPPLTDITEEEFLKKYGGVLR